MCVSNLFQIRAGDALPEVPLPDCNEERPEGDHLLVASFFQKHACMCSWSPPGASRVSQDKEDRRNDRADEPSQILQRTCEKGGEPCHDSDDSGDDARRPPPRRRRRQPSAHMHQLWYANRDGLDGFHTGRMPGPSSVVHCECTIHYEMFDCTSNGNDELTGVRVPHLHA